MAADEIDFRDPTMVTDSFQPESTRRAQMLQVLRGTKGFKLPANWIEIEKGKEQMANGICVLQKIIMNLEPVVAELVRSPL